MIVDFDDFGANHVISDLCQSHDCRDKLLELKEINPAFKVTLFSIPGEMTSELTHWGIANKDWVELAIHGFYHTSNYECEKMEYMEFDKNIRSAIGIYPDAFAKGFKAPGWQISDDVYKWLKDHNWWVADQSYNDERRPKGLKSYVIREDTPSWHGHTWDCVGNGIYETFDELSQKVADAKEFQFVSEVVS